MAEPKLSSKKRKRPSCPTYHPLAGIFTRSKSQIYLHRNRSGRARPDSSRLDLYPVSKKPTIVDSSSVDDLSGILIKDLRARRIFSDGCSFRAENAEEMMKLGSGFSLKSCSVTGGDDEDDIEKVDSGFCSQLMNADFTNPEPSSSDVGVGPGDAKVREDGKLNANPSLVLEEPRYIEECDLSSGVGSLNKECVHTPLLPKEGGNGNKKLEFVSRSTDQFTDNQSNGSNQKIERKGKNFRTKSFHSPSSRVKLFKAPGSFSYRRLLPYLADITKDNSCAPKMGRPLKTEKGLEEKQFPSSHCQEALISEPKTESSAIKSNEVDSVNESNSKPIECIQESSMLFDSQEEVCKGRGCSQTSVSMVEEWSKPIFDRGIEEFVIKVSSKDQKLKTNPALCLNKNNLSSYYSDYIIPIYNRESENSLAEDSCDPENMKTINSSLSLIMDKCDSGKDNDICQSSEDKKQYKTEGLHKSDVGDSPICNTLHLRNPNLSKGEQNGNLSNAEQRDNDDAEVLDHADNSNEECVQSTPPDVDIFFKPEVVGNHGRTLHNFDHALGKPLSGNSNRCSSCINNKNIDSNPRQNLVLKQCSRLKLFKTPGSMTYRRMLPFLMDATKDNLCASRKCNCLKLEKSLEANLLSPSLVSTCQEMPIGNSNGNCHHVEGYTDSSSALPITMSTASSNEQEQNLSSYQHVNKSPKPFYSQLASGVYFEQNLSDTNMMLETAPHESKSLATPLCSLLISGSFPGEDAKLGSHEPYVNTGECRKSVIEVSNHAKQIHPESLYQDLSPHEASFPVTVHKKGILKRTPRGCRGPCTCLNCSSFRLHAERGFEFSRNQMQDAEEVALQLIKELSYIRNMLEKSAFGADGYAAVCINQVKEACRRASEAEVLAQNRLGEMNFDLNIHCRLTCDQRPRVRFANYVEEKVITESDLPSK